MELDDEVVRQACLNAAEMLSGISYAGKFGSFHLLRDLNLQTNTVTAILHNIVAWQISRLDCRWVFRPKGGRTADLTCGNGGCIQIKTTSGSKILGNRVSKGAGQYIAVRYELSSNNLLAIDIKEILVGTLASDDWDRREGTQWAILKAEAQAKMRRIYP